MWQSLDHNILKLLKENALQQKQLLVAFSGGADSTALLKILTKVHPGKVSACYFHHGEESNTVYRNDASQFCKELCLSLKIPFYSLKSKLPAYSEEDFRKQRYEAINSLMREQNLQVLCTGHHSDDLLETRLLRLIRGTGAQGLKSMSFYKENVFRPLLSSSKKDLIQYLKNEEVLWLEDPTNEDSDPLRNWVRNFWLPKLEEKNMGAMSSLSRSLEIITGELDSSQNDLLIQNKVYSETSLHRSFYLTLAPKLQKRLLAQYLFALGKRDFSQSHLEEIQKQVDSPKKNINFKIGGCAWVVNESEIKVRN